MAKAEQSVPSRPKPGRRRRPFIKSGDDVALRLLRAVLLYEPMKHLARY